MSAEEPLRTVGPYTIHRPLATGGMATIHYGRLRGDSGFARVVAIKRLHPARAAKPENVAMLMDEARVSSRIRHPNVVPTLDVLEDEGELLLVLEYVQGASLQRILAELETRMERVPPPIAAAIVAGALRGVHAAHEAKDTNGEPLELIHRDLSPNNILVDGSGIARVLDFGVAKARGRMQQTTQVGGLKGTVGYIAPEQIHGAASRQSDVFAMGVVLWETLVGEHLFTGATAGEALASVLSKRVEPPSARGVDVPAELDQVVLKALARQRTARWTTALEMAAAIESSIVVATPSEVAAWLDATMAPWLEEQQRTLAEIEREDVPEAYAPDVPARRATPRRRAVTSRHIAIGAAAAGLFAVSVGVAIASKRPPPERAPESPDPATATALEPVPPPAAGSSEPEATPPPAPPRGDPRHRGRPSPAPARSSKECDPPYTLDPSGVKVWKRQCF